MPKNFFLHIGMKKTASSSIQSFLQQNAESLADAGYFFPWHNIAKHKGLAYIFQKKSRVKIDKDWEDLHQIIDSNSCNNIVISAEDFESSDESYVEAIQKELDRYNVKIIVYLRRQDLRFESHYLQSVKTGVFTGSIQSFLVRPERYNLDYLLFLNTWSKYFGNENIIVRALEKTQIPDVCLDFLKILGHNLDDSNFQKLDSSKNVKPALEQMIAVKFLNELLAKKIGKTEEGFFQMHLNHDFNRKYYIPLVRFTQEKGWNLKKSYKVLPSENAQEILQRYKESNQEVARRYLDRTDGTLFYEELQQEYDVEDLDIRNLSQDYLIDLCSYCLSINCE